MNGFTIRRFAYFNKFDIVEASVGKEASLSVGKEASSFYFQLTFLIEILSIELLYYRRKQKLLTTITVIKQKLLTQLHTLVIAIAQY